MGLVQGRWGTWAACLVAGLSQGARGAAFEELGAGRNADPEPLLRVAADLG